MNRRDFTKLSAGAAAFIAVSPVGGLKFQKNQSRKNIPLEDRFLRNMMTPKLGSMPFTNLAYRAAYSPVNIDDDEATVRAYAKAAKKSGIIIAEVGAWSNPISPDETQRKEAFEKCVRSLQLAEQLGANCCVNVSGSRNKEYWAGPHRDNLSSRNL